MKRFADILAWVFSGLAVLSLVAWPLMIWRHVSNGLPVAAATLETLPYALGTLLFWIIARGFKLSMDLPRKPEHNRPLFRP